MDFEAKLFKVLGDQLGSACFLLAELWVLVDVPSPLDHLLLDLGSADKGLLLERVRLGGCVAGKRHHCQAQCTDRGRGSEQFAS